MQIRECPIAGFIVKSNFPSTNEEFDSLAKKQGAVLEVACDYEDYHNHRGSLRESFVSLLTESFGIERRQIPQNVYEGEGEDKVEVTKPEKFEVFVNRVKVEKGLEDADLQKVADRLSHGGDKEVLLNLAATERKAPKPPTIAKKDIEEATKFLAESDENRINKFIAHAKKKFNVGVVFTPGDNEANIKAFARASMDIRRATNAFGV